MLSVHMGWFPRGPQGGALSLVQGAMARPCPRWVQLLCPDTIWTLHCSRPLDTLRSSPLGNRQEGRLA